MINFYVGQTFGEKGVFTAVITAVDGSVISYTYTYDYNPVDTKTSQITKASLNSWVHRSSRNCWCDPDRVVVVVDTID